MKLLSVLVGIFCMALVAWVVFLATYKIYKYVTKEKEDKK